MGYELSLPKMSLSPNCETHRRWIVQNFLILIVSAVQICKQYLQTATVSGGHRSPDRLPGLCFGPHWGLPSPNPMGCSSQMKIREASAASLRPIHRHKACLCSDFHVTNAVLPTISAYLKLMPYFLAEGLWSFKHWHQQDKTRPCLECTIQCLPLAVIRKTVFDTFVNGFKYMLAETLSANNWRRFCSRCTDTCSALVVSRRCSIWILESTFSLLLLLF